MSVHWMVFATAFVTYFTIIVGYHRFFRNVTQEKHPAGLRVIRGIFPAAVIVNLVTLGMASNVPLSFQVSGLVLYLATLALFLWTARANSSRPLTLAYSPDTPVHLNTQGPYRWIRHPYYASYLLGFCAGAVAAASFYLLTVAVIVMSVYTHAAKTEEEKFEHSELRDAYDNYKKRTGRFLPRFF